MKNFLAQMYRLRWALGFSVLAIFVLDVIQLDPESDLARAIYKMVTATIACVVADLITWSIFPTYELNDFLKESSSSQRQLVGMIYVGRCLVLVAIILGITLGL